MKYKLMELGVKLPIILGVIVMGIIAFFIIPFVSFWLAYLGGWIAKIMIGKYLVEGFDILGITLPIDKVPLIAGVLGWIGGYFKQNTSYNVKTQS